MDDPKNLEQMDTAEDGPQIDSDGDSDVQIDIKIKPSSEILEIDEDENEKEDLTMDINPMHFLNFCDNDGGGDRENNEFPDDENGQEDDLNDDDDGEEMDGCDDDETDQKVEVLIPSSRLDASSYNNTNLNEEVLEKLQESDEESSDGSFTSPSDSDSDEESEPGSDSEPVFARDPMTAILILEQLDFPKNSYSDGTFDLNHRVFSNYICRDRKKLEKMKRESRKHHLDVRKRRQYNGYFCYFCRDNFRNIDELGLHELNHQKNEFICDFCKMKFLSKDILNKHCLKHGGIKTRFFKCLRCTFKGSREKVQKHYQNKDCIKPKNQGWNHKRVRFGCTFCPITYPSIGERDDHQKTHFKVEYNCTVCDRNFSTPLILAMHISRAHNEQQQPANIEDGEGENLFGCQFCPEKFILELDCETHQNSHFSKEYFCMICKSKKYSTEFALKSHMNREHNIGVNNTDENPQVNPKICHFCLIDFHTEKNCQIHKKLHFENVEIGEISCAICKTEKFTNKKQLQAHAKTCLKSAGQISATKPLPKDNNDSQKAGIPTSSSNKVSTYQFRPENSTATNVLYQIGLNRAPVVKQITRQVVKYEANCPVCGIGLFNSSWLTSHLKLVHKLSDDQINLKLDEKGDFVCQMCPFKVKFKSQIQLDQHFRDHHDSNKTGFGSIVSKISLNPTNLSLQCKVCFHDFQSEPGLRSHMSHVHGIGKNPQQGKTIIVKSSQLGHFNMRKYKKANAAAPPVQVQATRIVKKLSKDNRYDKNVLNVGFCSICKNSYSNIDYHNQEFHNIVKDKDQDPLASSGSEEDSEVEEKSESESEFRCKICFMDFLTKILLQKHISRVHDKKNEEKVDKNKNQNGSAVNKKIESKNDQVFICEEGKCRKKEFFTQKLYEQHMKFIHKVSNSPEKKPIETEIKSLRSSSRSTRTSGKKWICGICFCNFDSQAKLDEHEKHEHDEEEDEVDEKEEFKCKFCPKKSFLTESLFLQHMKWIHKK